MRTFEQKKNRVISTISQALSGVIMLKNGEDFTISDVTTTLEQELDYVFDDASLDEMLSDAARLQAKEISRLALSGADPEAIKKSLALYESLSAIVTVKQAKSPSKQLEKTIGSSVFEHYSEAFKARYGVLPARNKDVNRWCKSLGEKLGEDAFEVVRFYLQHNDGWYLKNQHSIKNCLDNAEALYTQWQRGHAVTSAHVRDAEKVVHKNEIKSQLSNLFSESEQT